MMWNQEPSICTDPNVLGESHVPPDIPGRGAQIDELALALRPAAQRRKPIHCWVHGDPGSGKTATTRWLLRKLGTETSVKGLYVNCWEYPTYFAVLDRIVRELRVLGAERLTVSFKLERLQRYLDNDPLILVLDEIDQPTPKERHSMLYNLGQIANVGLVCVCNSEHIYFGLEDRVKSRLNAVRVRFAEYSTDDVVAILRERARDALTSGSWSERTLVQIAELAEGDARVAIQTLRNAAMLAEKDGLEAIDMLRVHRAWRSAKDVKKTHLLRKLTDHHRLLYELIA